MGSREGGPPLFLPPFIFRPVIPPSSTALPPLPAKIRTHSVCFWLFTPSTNSLLCARGLANGCDVMRLAFLVTTVRRRFGCWRGEIGKRSGVASRRANAPVGSTPTASTAALDSESSSFVHCDCLRCRVASSLRIRSRRAKILRLFVAKSSRPVLPPFSYRPLSTALYLPPS